TRRYTFRNKIEIVDLGLRMVDIDGLQDESAFDKGDIKAKARNLRENGATQAEIDFLLYKRVELNAMTADQLVAFVERKLVQHGVKKIVSEKEHLAEAYRLFDRDHRIQKVIEEELKKTPDAESVVPNDIEQSVQKILDKHPAMRWIDAVQQIVKGDDQPADAG